MCCLGFACIAAGFSEKQILNVSTPVELIKILAGSIATLPDILLSLVADSAGSSHSAPCLSLMNGNDSVELTDTERERHITELGATVGLEFMFTG